MAIFIKPFLRALLLASSLVIATEATVTCTDLTVQSFSNPSFETGDLTGWTPYRANNRPSDGSVVSGDAADGSYYYTIKMNSIWTYLKQTLTDLDTTKTYDLSVDYRITGGLANQLCYVGWSKDNWGSFLKRTSVYSSTSQDWTNYSESWQPTASSHDIYFVFACPGGPTGSMDFDNFKMPIAVTSVCSTSTPSPTASISSSALASSFASSTAAVTSTPAISSSVVIGVAHSSALSGTPRVSSIVVSTPILSTPSSTPSTSAAHVSSPIPVQSSSAIPVHSSPSGHFPSLISSKPVTSAEATSSSIVPSQSASLTPSSIPSTSTPSTVSSQHFNTPVSSAHVSSQPHLQPSSSAIAIPVPSSTGLTSSAPSSVPTFGNGSTGSSGGSGQPTSLSPIGSSQPNGGSPPVTGLPAGITNRPGIPKASEAPPVLTTSTVLTTRLSTITACPSTVSHCPAASRTTFVTTETVVAYTTVCPATETMTLIQATETTSSIFSTRTSTMTSCPDRQQYCALPNRKTETSKETILVSTTVYLAAVPTSDRRPVFVGEFGNSGTSSGSTQNHQSSGYSSGSSGEGEGVEYIDSIDQHAEYQAEVTRTQFVFSTLYVTQTALATACPSVQGPPTESQLPASSGRPVYF